MPQNTETGAAANRYGKETAAKIAKLLRATRLSDTSNEVNYEGTHAVIKCARYQNPYIGVTVKMLERLDRIIAAFEKESGEYDLYVLTPTTFKENMRIGYHKHIGLVLKRVIKQEGNFLTSLSVD